MSEYWKSTPKYWCKHCKTYVRDTKLEKANHDATPRHQGNIKRFVRDLHKGHEKDEREKERAKSEIARLNGIVSGSSSGPSGPSSSGFARGPTPSHLPKPTPGTSSRKEQLAQLVDMGVSIPDEFRRELAMEGDWQVVSERVIDPTEDKKPDAIGFGVRKRPAEGGEEEDDAKEIKRKRWGSTHRTHATNNDDDLDALLKVPLGKGKASEVPSFQTEIKTEVKTEEERAQNSVPVTLSTSETNIDDKAIPKIKHEPIDGEVNFSPSTDDIGMQPTEAVMFKKRAKKNIRQK